ncbi:hypothetical protein M885DRAFT_524752 [Pelagophyceae sp. CCMP2097]|nr:hypothetical protein M885DRAFT_524752 [Pelagophyceae sp. CCMP2097]
MLGGSDAEAEAPAAPAAPAAPEEEAITIILVDERSIEFRLEASLLEESASLHERAAAAIHRDSKAFWLVSRGRIVSGRWCLGTFGVRPGGVVRVVPKTDWRPPPPPLKPPPPETTATAREVWHDLRFFDDAATTAIYTCLVRALAARLVVHHAMTLASGRSVFARHGALHDQHEAGKETGPAAMALSGLRATRDVSNTLRAPPTSPRTAAILQTAAAVRPRSRTSGLLARRSTTRTSAAAALQPATARLTQRNFQPAQTLSHLR